MWPQDQVRTENHFALHCPVDRRVVRYPVDSYEHLTLDGITGGGAPRLVWKARCDRVTKTSQTMLRGLGNDCVESHPATRDFLSVFGQVSDTEAKDVKGMTMTDTSTRRTYAAIGNSIQWPESVVPGHTYNLCSTSRIARPAPLSVAFTFATENRMERQQ